MVSLDYVTSPCLKKREREIVKAGISQLCEIFTKVNVSAKFCSTVRKSEIMIS
jgi:hypothetical protein